MNCATCKVNKIGPNTAPFGGFLCGNEHLQCNICNARSEGQCGLCDDNTNFVQMNFNRKSPTPTAPVMEAEPGMTSHDPHTYVFPRSFFTDLEAQSSISQEQLSMHDSHESLNVETHTLLEQQIQALALKVQQQQQQYDNQLQQHVHQQQQQMQQQQRHQQLQHLHLQQLKQQQVQQKQQHQSEVLQKLVFDQRSLSPVHAPLKRLENSQMVTLFLTENDQLKTESSALEVEQALRGNIKTNQHSALSLGEDPEDVIHTSEIRFMESTESMKNYYSDCTMHPIVTTETETPSSQPQAQQTVLQPSYSQKCNHHEPLSVKKLYDFERQNIPHPNEAVEHYLRNYGPLALCQFPAYSLMHNCCEGTCDSYAVSQQRDTNLRSVSNSTESEPTLASVSTAKKRVPGKYPPTDYFLMQATGVTEPASGTIQLTTSSDKGVLPSIDIRMQKVLETFQEDPRQPKLCEKPLLDKSKALNKVPITDLVQPSATAVVESASKTPVVQSMCALPDDEKSNEIKIKLSNTQRAYYNPPSQSLCSEGQLQDGFFHKEPLPQFQHIICSATVANELLQAKGRYINMKSIPACQLNIPRSPIQCPESSCHRMIFVSDFNKHLVVDHNSLTMERITPEQCKNFLLDPRLAHSGVNKCNLLYLIRNKITDLGSSKFKDFMPLLVMSSHIKLSQLCGISEREPAFASGNTDFLMIWLTGLVPEEIPVSISLTVWSRAGQVPSCHLVHSGSVYSVRDSQQAIDVYQSGKMLLLSPHEVRQLTNGGKDMLELQIVVH